MNRILILTTIIPNNNDKNYIELVKTINILLKEKIDIYLIYFDNNALTNNYDKFLLSRINLLRIDLNEAIRKPSKVLNQIDKYLRTNSIKKIFSFINNAEINSILLNFYKKNQKNLFIHSIDEINFNTDNIKHYMHKNKTDNFEDSFYEFIEKEKKTSPKYNILQVNNVDILGRRFNGYDIMEKINLDTNHSAFQIVIDKLSDNRDVYNFFYSDEVRYIENQIQEFEKEQLSIHSNLSTVSHYLENNDIFKHADIVHYHLIHNTKIPLCSLPSLFSQKPTIMSIHDPWNFTGRCVQPEECLLWKDGCINCPNLSSEFPLKDDNCHFLWKLKQNIYKKMDIDIVVSTEYMKNMLLDSELTNHFKNVHVIPFGVDLDYFNDNLPKELARKKLNIPKDDIVLFHRAQLAFKGTKYFESALKELDTDKNITIITCSAIGLLKEVESKYNVLDLGNLDNDKLLQAYAACDIFVMPSIGESFGMMAIEAMACGKPVIIFDNTALPSVTFAPECGYLVKNKDSHELMKGLKQLIEDDSERNRRGKLGRKYAETYYNSEEYNKKIIELYEKVYVRQINKQIITQEDNVIDYKNPDTLNLTKLINQYSKKMFLNEIPIFEFSNNSKDSVFNNTKIDYSLDSVQGVIKEFNKKVYEKFLYYEENYKVQPKSYKEITKTKKINKILLKVKNNLYRTLRKGKQILKNFAAILRINQSLENKINNLEKEISDLNMNIYDYQLNIEILCDKIESVSKKIDNEESDKNE